MPRLIDIIGLGQAHAQRLAEIGITTVAELHELGATPQGRREIARRANVPEADVRDWVHQADLLTIVGVGEGNVDLVHAAGIHTTADLVRQDPHELYQRLTQINEERHFVGPETLDGEVVAGWIEQARSQPSIVEDEPVA